MQNNLLTIRNARNSFLNTSNIEFASKTQSIQNSFSKIQQETLNQSNLNTNYNQNGKCEKNETMQKNQSYIYAMKALQEKIQSLELTTSELESQCLILKQEKQQQQLVFEALENNLKEKLNSLERDLNEEQQNLEEKVNTLEKENNQLKKINKELNNQYAQVSKQYELVCFDMKTLLEQQDTEKQKIITKIIESQNSQQKQIQDQQQNSKSKNQEMITMKKQLNESAKKIAELKNQLIIKEKEISSLKTNIASITVPKDLSSNTSQRTVSQRKPFHREYSLQRFPQQDNMKCMNQKIQSNLTNPNNLASLSMLSLIQTQNTSKNTDKKVIIRKELETLNEQYQYFSDQILNFSGHSYQVQELRKKLVETSKKISEKNQQLLSLKTQKNKQEFPVQQQSLLNYQ